MLSENTKIFTTTVFNNGKITIPSDQRSLHKIIDGDVVTVQIKDINHNRRD